MHTRTADTQKHVRVRAHASATLWLVFSTRCFTEDVSSFVGFFNPQSDGSCVRSVAGRRIPSARFEGVVSPAEGETRQSAALVADVMWIRFQCLTSLKWLSRVRVQEEDYGFLPVTRWNPEGCHGSD